MLTFLVAGTVLNIVLCKTWFTKIPFKVKIHKTYLRKNLCSLKDFTKQEFGT